MSPSLLAASLLLAGASLMPASPPTTAQGGAETPEWSIGAPATATARPGPSEAPSPTGLRTPPYPSVQPAPKPTAKPATRRIVRGVMSWMPERYGASYLALPNGPGHLVKICGAGGCIVMRSNDAGPDRAMQRAGRVADIGVLAWERLCGLGRSRGLCAVTVEALP